MTATESDFPSLPPFPADIPTAPLLRLSLSSLLTPTAIPNSESNTLFAICKDLGFFYLDLRNTELGEKLLTESNELFGVEEQLFGLGREELGKYDFEEKRSVYGYKGFGKNYIIDENGATNKDRNEMYNVSKDDLHKNSSEPFPQPALLNEKAPLLKSYTENAHALARLLLSHLNNHLDLPPNTLESLHDQSRISGDHIRFIKAPPQPYDDLKAALGKHTDFGSVTILFNRLGGLQVQLPGEQTDWHYVRPLPGHCIVNLGDAMVKFTNGLLRSNIHRVVPPPGLQASCTRYSLVYFCRPADDVLLKRLEGSDVIPPLGEGVVEEDVDSKTWIKQKSLANRVGIYKKDPFYEVDRSTVRTAERRAVVV